MKTNYKILILLAGSALLVALGVAVSFWAYTQIELSAQKRAQTSIVIKKTNALLSSIKDAETGGRGYLLTGDEAFLEPYLLVRDSFTTQMEDLRQIPSTSLTQKHLEILAPLVDARLAHLTHAIELYRNHDVSGAIAVVRSGEGKRLMDSIRVEIGSIQQIEENALVQREAEFQANMRFLFILIVVSSLLVLLLTFGLVLLIYREIQQRVKNSLLLETQRFLEIQKEMNNQLQRINTTLRVSEEKLAVTLNSIGDAVIATDDKGLVALMNPLAEHLTGWSLAEAIHHPVDEVFRIISEETRQPVSSPVMETLAHGTVHGLVNHTILIALNNSECPIADSCAPIRVSGGDVLGAVLVFRDVTERSRLDRTLQENIVELLKARLVAEKANLAKSEFLSSMSHELRSPLNAILGFAQLLDSETPPPTSAQKQSLAQILQAGWHLLKLIDEILDLAKVESGQVPLSPEPVSLAEVMLECQGMIAPQAQQREINLIMPRFEIPYFVRADRTRLKQVMINLLSNAIKYNLYRGTVEVKISDTTREHIRISISDTGAGLQSAQIAQLFQAFNRLGQEANGIEGTGIGLVVAKRLVELMGGTIGVESTVGVGSVFWFELYAVGEPRLPVELDDPTTSPTSNIGSGVWKHTLLYVEDNPANLKLVEQIIARRPDIHLLTAINGNSGIEIARASLPDAILMDINLPDISGFEALQILRANPSTVKIPIVALSANAMPRDIKKGLEAGFLCYITKPIKIKEFVEALDLALDFALKNTE